MDESIEQRDRRDDEILNVAFSDEALENAAGSGRQDMANPTVPSALICLPFEPARD